MKDIQRHPVRRDVIHVDFLRVDRDKTVDVEVPIVLEGEAEAVAREDGVVDQLLTSLLDHRQAGRHPQRASRSTSPTWRSATPLRVGDLALPAGVTTSVDPEDTVVTAQHGVSEAELEAAEAEVAGEAEGAEGEAAEGEAAEGDAAEASGDGGDAAPPRAATRADVRSSG